jgi:hypothetical protein
MNCHMRHDYWPKFYDGTVMVLIPNESTIELEARRAELSRYAREVNVITIPGKRFGLFLQPAVDELARHLQAGLETVEERPARAGGAETKLTIQKL